MQEVNRDSLSPETGEIVSRLEDLLDQPDNVRIIRTSTGYLAVVIDHCKSTDDSQLVISLAERVNSRLSTALVLTDLEITKSHLEQTLDEMTRIYDLVAIPSGAVSQADNEYVPVGQIDQRFHDAISAEFVILKRKSGIRERLLRNAPIDVGEEADNLSGREGWFAKRHSRDS